MIKKFVMAYAEDGSEIGEVPVYFYNIRNEKNRALLDQRITCNDYRNMWSSRTMKLEKKYYIFTAGLTIFIHFDGNSKYSTAV